MKVAIIGSGMSGLIAGATLAKARHRVSIFEQSDQAGGVTASFEKDGYKWELGQLVVEGFGPDEPVGAILEELGVLDKIALSKEDRGYVLPDFAIEKPTEFGGVKWRIDLLKELFPEDASGLDRYWKDYLRFLKIVTLGRKMEKASGLTSLLLKARFYATLLPLLRKKDWSAQQLMDDYFNSERLKCVFISILADFFVQPSQFIGLGVFALNHETFYDKREPKLLARDAEQTYFYNVHGGLSTLVDALIERIKHYGGEIITNQPIAQIKIANHRAIGVVNRLGGFIPADVVIASGGAKETFFKLINEAQLPKEFAEQIRGIPLMDSVFMVHLGVDFDPSPYVHGVCTYYYGTYDIEGGVATAKSGQYHEGKDGFVVHIPSLHSPQMAPEGRHALTIYTICPDTLAKGDWDSLKEEYADKLIGYAEKYIPGLAAHTQLRVIMTPADFRKRTHLDHHAFGGIAPIMGKSGAPHKTPIEGLWFVGAQSESGGGLPNVIPGAYRTAKTIAGQ
ncbi:MAG: phytoene desaturase family protein [Anaerolineales bacterium]